ADRASMNGPVRVLEFVSTLLVGADTEPDRPRAESCLNIDPATSVTVAAATDARAVAETNAQIRIDMSLSLSIPTRRASGPGPLDHAQPANQATRNAKMSCTVTAPLQLKSAVPPPQVV